MTRKPAYPRLDENRADRLREDAYQLEGISIETVAARAGVTVRRVQYLQREGLVTPIDTASSIRYFDESAVDRVQLVERLIADLGVNLPGAEVILHMRERMFALLDEIDRLQRR
jgi:DNA-binding transcriptional MerR regulator